MKNLYKKSLSIILSVMILMSSFAGLGFATEESALLADNFNELLKDYRANIVTVTFEDRISKVEDAVEKRDISKNENSAVTACIVMNLIESEKATNEAGLTDPNSSILRYDLYIMANGKTFMGEGTKELFNNFTALKTINGLQNLDTSMVTDMSEMFGNCNKLTSLDLSSFDTSRVTNMSFMFSGCNSLESLNLNSFDTQNVKYMNNMFQNCQSLTELDIKSFKTNNVLDMQYMFQNCHRLSKIYAGTGWSVESVISSTNMFFNCTVLKGKEYYDSSKVTAAYANTDYYLIVVVPSSFEKALTIQKGEKINIFNYIPTKFKENIEGFELGKDSNGNVIAGVVSVENNGETVALDVGTVVVSAKFKNATEDRVAIFITVVDNMTPPASNKPVEGEKEPSGIAGVLMGIFEKIKAFFNNIVEKLFGNLLLGVQSK